MTAGAEEQGANMVAFTTAWINTILVRGASSWYTINSEKGFTYY
jgi:hypothetical protein